MPGVGIISAMAAELTLLSEFIANLASLVAFDRSVSSKKKGTTSLQDGEGRGGEGRGGEGVMQQTK